VAGDPHALEPVSEPDISVEVTGIFVKVQERTGTPREVATLALPQRGELAQLNQQGLHLIKVLLRRMPHRSSIT